MTCATRLTDWWISSGHRAHAGGKKETVCLTTKHRHCAMGLIAFNAVALAAPVLSGAWSALFIVLPVLAIGLVVYLVVKNVEIIIGSGA